MLKLNQIVKDYAAGDTTVHALRGISLEFRRQEFVAILGPSGCGKTTLLNIIGGLDQYTSGDLLIKGRSTRQFSDRDWDSYRNHSIGFVFQSYNLIPHQSVLQNVELALTLSGVSRTERRERAKRALERVGLGDQLSKKPNQMSGGQMQRVAIARALVNDPEILLADEPTGALDSETSVQIMELLKEISHEKLIIMVTHNPELVAKYATRTIRLLDGAVVSDSAPYEESAQTAPAAQKKPKRTSMSFFTALGLSLNNLMTKKARTILTAFAGSIGIIGIALILALSNGIQNYIDDVQEDTLSSYPITIEAESMDMSAMVSSLMGAHEDADSEPHEDGRVYASTVMYELMNSFNQTETQTNDLAAFREYLADPDSEIHQYLSAVQYSYDLTLPIYAKDTDGNIVKADVMELMQNMMSSLYGGDYSAYFSRFGSFYSSMDVWEELLPGEDGESVSPLVQSQYDVLYGHWPQSYDEVVLVVSKNDEISDLVMYAMGLKTEAEMNAAMQDAMDEKEVSTEAMSWSYEELCGRTFKLILPCENYRRDAQGGYTDLSLTDAGMDYLFGSDDVGTTLKISGIVRPNPDAAATMLSGSIGYTGALSEYVMQQTAGSEIVRAQLDDPDTDVLTALPFKTDDTEEPTEDEKNAALTELLSAASAQEKAQMYLDMMQQPAEEYLNAMTEQTMQGMTRESIEQQMAGAYAEQMGISAEEVQGYIAQMDDETLFSYVEQMVRESIAQQYAEGIAQQLGAMTADQLAAAMDMTERTQAQTDYLYESYAPARYSDSTYSDVLDTLGYVEPGRPSKVSLYAATFSDKDAIADCISRYNETVSEEQQLTYTDYVALLMSSITTIINAISYVLIAFVAISLVVSSIMIGIITYISVLERTKEIGILRAIGASKRDIARVFNAETLIEGLIAGLIGIGLTLVLILPNNAIVQHLTGIATLGAELPAAAGAVLVAISMVLTFIAGLIPSRLAARKDPVVALRSE